MPLWKDPNFPHNNKSIGVTRDVEWKPIREISATPDEWQLFDGIHPNDLKQGEVGNCWLIAAMACIAEFPPVVEGMFTPKTKSQDGKYAVRLYDEKQGKMIDVNVDEYVPCRPKGWVPGGPIFTKPNGEEMWCLLLEKAMAKHYGSYEELSGGTTAMAFRSFTGESNTYMWKRKGGPTTPWSKWTLHPTERHFTSSGTPETKDPKDLFLHLKNCDECNFLMGASIKVTHGSEHERPDGLVEGHAFSLIEVVECEGHKLLMLRNPWGNDKEWNGAWSDNDKKWEKHPEVKAKLDPEFGDDGLFWMCWEDFVKVFDDVSVCERAMREGEAAAEHTRLAKEGVAAKPGAHVKKPHVMHPSGPAAASGWKEGLVPGGKAANPVSKRTQTHTETITDTKSGKLVEVKLIKTTVTFDDGSTAISEKEERKEVGNAPPSREKKAAAGGAGQMEVEDSAGGHRIGSTGAREYRVSYAPPGRMCLIISFLITLGLVIFLMWYTRSTTSKGNWTGDSCNVNAVVGCPNDATNCVGNQCCPSGDTCPSADPSFASCAKPKSKNCIVSFLLSV